MLSLVPQALMSRKSLSIMCMAVSALACLACGSTPESRSDTAAHAARTTDTSPTTGATETSPATSATETPPRAVVEPVLLSEHGLGAVRVGMTLKDASAAAKSMIVAPPAADTAECGFATWKDGPKGVRFMTARGRIARVDVTSGAVVTEAGARTGDSEDRISSLYPGRVQVTPSKYSAGHYLTVRGASPVDSMYRLIFETDGKRVTAMRAGRMPQVAYVEGCG